MDAKEEERLLAMFDDVDSDEYVEPSSDDMYSGSSDNYSPTPSVQLFSSESEDNGEENDIDHEFDLTGARSPDETLNEETEEDEDLGDDGWCNNRKAIPVFDFDMTLPGIKVNIGRNSKAEDFFRIFWNKEIMDLIINSTNCYSEKLTTQCRPKTRNSRSKSFRKVDEKEMTNFFALCLLQGQMKFCSVRRMFSYDPLNYHPIFSATMSGRRFEQILRCLSVEYGSNNKDNKDRLVKIRNLLTLCLEQYQTVFYPDEALSLDESLLLFRGRLNFRTYMKGKKTKYGIKFYELCSPDGYVHNIEIYKGKSNDDEETDDSKIDALVLRLMKPFLKKGHHIFMDNYYNSVTLCNKLLKQKTHVTGTLRKNRNVIASKLKRGEYQWARNGHVYVSKWRDNRDVLCITTKYHPEIIETSNRHNIKKMKPREVAEYNKGMSGIDRSDQMISYYSCPRKTIRWYKKIIFHLLDISVWNSFYIYKKFNNSKKSYIEYREKVIASLLGIENVSDGRKLVPSGPLHGGSRNNIQVAQLNVTETGHFQEKIPAPENYKRKNYFLRCRQCSKHNIRKETSWRCKTCQNNPPLCAGKCFEDLY